MKRHLQYPDISNFSDFSSYLRQVFALNKELGIPLSIGSLARRLGWSKSLLKGFLGGRRRITMRRALEFAQFAGMGLWEHERICKLALDFPQHEMTPEQLCDVSMGAELSLKTLGENLGYDFGDSNPFFQPSETYLLSISEQEMRLLKSKIYDISRSLKKYQEQNSIDDSESSAQNYLFDFSILKILSTSDMASIQESDLNGEPFQQEIMQNKSHPTLDSLRLIVQSSKRPRV